MSGRFIVLEGPDGAGTTTHAALLAEHLKARGEDVFLTSEPTKGPIGRFIRERLSKGDIGPAAPQLLFSADRAWHIENDIEPALNEGKTVISDRYWLSTVIYAKALGIDPDLFVYLNKKFIQPDIQIILLPSFKVALSRIEERKSKDMLEEGALQARVYDGYKDYARREGVPVVDTGGEMNDVAQMILKEVS